MPKFLLIILVSIHLLGNTEVSQLFKIPKLITHYFEHCRLNPAISFIQFLNMHYGGSDGADADNEKDNQLPCHNFHHNTLTVICFKIQDPPSLIFLNQYIKLDYGRPTLDHLPQKLIFPFFQPPRVS